MGARTFRKKKQQQSRVFFGVIFLTEKEPERVIENKGDDFRRKKNMEMLAPMKQGAASKVKMSGSER